MPGILTTNYGDNNEVRSAIALEINEKLKKTKKRKSKKMIPTQHVNSILKNTPKIDKGLK